jgi:hypothetical protein
MLIFKLYLYTTTDCVNMPIVLTQLKEEEEELRRRMKNEERIIKNKLIHYYIDMLNIIVKFPVHNWHLV